MKLVGKLSGFRPELVMSLIAEYNPGVGTCGSLSTEYTCLQSASLSQDNILLEDC